MLMSVFTPVHDTRWIDDCYASLKIQSGPEWEWVLLVSADLPVPLPREIQKDPNVRVLYYHSTSLGELKKIACEQCTGDIMVELDSDDMLLPGVLEKIADQKDEGDFFYSDDAVFLDNGAATPYTYPENYGWDKYQVNVFGTPMWAMRNFDVNARSLSDIMFCPDHVRAWTYEAYERVGGHDPGMKVVEDQELMCRMYLSGARFKHIGGCGYLYRSHQGNTSRVKNEHVGKQVARTRDRYLYRLVGEWCRRNKLKMVTLQPEHLPKIKNLDFADNSVGAYFAFDFLQLLQPSEVKDFMHEVYRTLVPGGWLCTYTPLAGEAGAAQHYHASAWNEVSFWPYVNRRYTRYVQPSKARFQLVRCVSRAPNSSYAKRGIKYMWADLCALKGQRQPGPIEI